MKKYTASATSYLRQIILAERIGAEYRRRLVAEGFNVGVGALDDCIMISSDAQSCRVGEIFNEVCAQYGVTRPEETRI